MTQRFICPHCHQPLDPLRLEIADNAGMPCLVCPECDEPFLLPPCNNDFKSDMSAMPALPFTAIHGPANATESRPL